MSEHAKCMHCDKAKAEHTDNPLDFSNCGDWEAAPTEGATMKDSHGQTEQCSRPHPINGNLCGNDKGHDGYHVTIWRSREHSWPESFSTPIFERSAKPQPTIVQDYREYTAEEILHGILQFSERIGWGDPANLGHWLGAAQRWALKENGMSEQLNAGIEAQREAFVKGAKWWEWHETDATMWPSDQRVAYEQAVEKYPDSPPPTGAAPGPLSPSPEIRYQLRNWHHVTCTGFFMNTCTCLEQREALIAELAAKESV